MFQLNAAVSLCNLLSMPFGEGHENPSSSVVAQTMELHAKNSYVYQLMDGSCHTVTIYLSDGKSQMSSRRVSWSLGGVEDPRC